MKLTYYLATFISFIFHPLLMVFYCVLLVQYVYDFIPYREINYQIILLSLVFVFTFILPAFFLLLMKKMGLIMDIELSKKEDRLIPYIFSAIFYLFIAFHLYNREFIDPLVYKLMLFGAFVISVTILINLRYKISAHTISCCTLVGFMIHLSFSYNEFDQLLVLVGGFLISGIIASSRLVLGAHDNFEITIGGILGIMIGMIAPLIIL